LLLESHLEGIYFLILNFTGIDDTLHVGSCIVVERSTLLPILIDKAAIALKVFDNCMRLRILVVFRRVIEYSLENALHCQSVIQSLLYKFSIFSLSRCSPNMDEGFETSIGWILSLLIVNIDC
jgi:hypothetical protein